MNHHIQCSWFTIMCCVDVVMRSRTIITVHHIERDDYQVNEQYLTKELGDEVSHIRSGESK